MVAVPVFQMHILQAPALEADLADLDAFEVDTSVDPLTWLVWCLTGISTAEQNSHERLQGVQHCGYAPATSRATSWSGEKNRIKFCVFCSSWILLGGVAVVYIGATGPFLLSFINSLVVHSIHLSHVLFVQCNFGVKNCFKASCR